MGCEEYELNEQSYFLQFAGEEDIEEMNEILRRRGGNKYTILLATTKNGISNYFTFEYDLNGYLIIHDWVDHIPDVQF
jgi:hypothetical protein